MRVFEIAFRSPQPLRDVVLASPLAPLPPLPRPAPPAPPVVEASPAVLAQQERQAIEQVLTQLRSAAAQLATRHGSLVAEMRQAAIELAVAVAGRVVFDKLQAGEFPIEEMVRQAIERLPPAPVVTVYLHPADLALLRRRLADHPLTAARAVEVRIEPDTSLARGACRTEAGEIHVLADLASQLAELRQHLLWSAGHARPEPAPAAP
jgi:flagellar biosynthesis/type III secretory pathway protein FliH